MSFGNLLFLGLFPTNFVSEIDTPVTSAPITPTTGIY
jgi:hypothetical protein